MKQKINFVLAPSLESRALAKIAVMLWNQEYDRRMVSKYDSNALERKLSEMQNEVLRRATELTLPETLKLQLMKIIQLVGENARSWIYFHCKYHDFVTKVPARFIWTSRGTVDYKRTAKVLVKDETLEILQRFRLACLYCLEDEIQELWNTLNIFGLHKSGYTRQSAERFSSIAFWYNYLEAQFIPKKYNFGDSAEFGNVAATRYFFKKLHLKDDGDFILETAKKVASKVSFSFRDYRDFPQTQSYEILLFLMSTMSVEQQLDLISSYTYAVLRCLLVWPYQNMLFETAKDKWHFLSKRHYFELLNDIFKSPSYRPEIFGEFWQQTPETYKEFITDDGYIGGLIRKLYIRKEEKNIQLVFKDLSLPTRKKLSFGKESLYIFAYLVRCEMWNLIKFLIDACVPSSKEIEMFENTIRKGVTQACVNENRWDKFFQLLKDCKEKAYRRQ